ncbi:tetratricopeptide repeat protein [candidate division KSB1 bacterium]|nr:tetratricopeptide repeat protein [candidate division KSB1 bacterium]
MRRDDHRFAEAEKYWESGKIKKAVAVFEDIIQDESLPVTARAVVCEYVGRLQIGIWKLKSAEQYLRRAIALDDDGVEHHVQLANCLCLQERQEEAWQLIRRLYQRHPDHPAAIHYMGKMSDERGMHAKGLALMKKSVRLEPANERFWSNLAFTYVMRGNPGAAMVCSEQAMALNPHDDVVQFVHKVASQFEQQEEPLKPAVTERPPKITAVIGERRRKTEKRQF